MSNESFSCPNIVPGSRGAGIFDLIKVLLDANLEVANYNNSNIYHFVCYYLRSNLGIAVIPLFLTKNGDGIKCFHDENLPIHFTARNSSVNMLKFLYEAYPESLTTLSQRDECNLLHLVLCDTENSSDVVVVKVKYLCEQCPQLIHKNSIQGNTPLHSVLYSYDPVRILCDIDETVVRDKCTPSDTDGTDDEDFDRLPLHFLVEHRSPISELSVEADCLRLFLRLHPASAGIKNGREGG
jgi:hypothetical protein